MRYLTLKEIPLAGLLLLLPVFSSCETWEEENRQARAMEMRAMAREMANDSNAFPNGRKAPPLAEADQVLYQEVGALFREGKNDPMIFDTTAAQAVELNAETESLLTHQQTAAAFAIAQAEESVDGKSQLLSASRQVRLLEGK